ncbi:thiamine pyrophosphate-dependent acetolactate synthase large subunit-like protein [Nocardia ignorata]|uniref:Thiamine pyrophosphate-dependent acetolactate synthase large subunit-like protein n=2 Tax=Nocardia ignorata TaxID=145285 RepID=A0A4R6PVW2_NOCIG|nr:thiamine pyrophosphate-dependent acetolactate synthase large subunit-like protein [Nocardia ignorata]
MQMNTNLGADVLGRPRFADALVDRLIGHDVRYLFGMPAESVNCLVDAVGRRSEIELIAVRHESAAAWMAVGYAQGSGTVGVCFGTAGPGATHLLPGVYGGLYDRVPVLAISGQVARAEIGTKSFQEIDSARLFRDGTWRSTDIVSPDQLAVFDQTVLSVRLEQTSAHLAVPSDVLNSPLEGLEQQSPYRFGARTTPDVDKKRVEDLAEYLCSTPGVIVLGAGGRAVADCALLLADALGVPIVALPEAGIPDWSVPPVEESDARQVLLIGKPTAGVARHFPSLELLLEITDVATSGFDEESRRIGIAGEVPQILHALVSAVWSRRGTPAAASAPVAPTDPNAPEGWGVLADALAGASVAVDSGATRELARRYLGERAHLHSAWNFEAEGSALPLAIGLALANGARSYALTDLDSLDQYISEFSTAARYDVPVTVVCRAEPGVPVSDLANAFGIGVSWAGDATELRSRLSEDRHGPALVLTSALADDRPAPAPDVDVVDYVTDLFAALVHRGIDCAYLSKNSRARLGATAELDLHVVADVQAAAMRATAAYKADGTTSCAVVTSPAELLGQLNGLYDAAFDDASVVLVSVETTPWLLDPVDVLADIAAVSVVLDGGAQDAVRLRDAFTTIAGGGRGVTHIHVTRTAIAARTSAVLVDSARSFAIPPSLIGLPGRATAAPEDIVRAAELIGAAGDISIIVGRGAAGARRELVELAARTGSPLYCTMGALAADVVGEHCAGLVGTSGTDDAMQRVRRSGLVIVVGVSWRGSAFEMVGHNPVISVNTDPLTFLRLPSDSVGLLGDARETLEALVGLLGEERDAPEVAERSRRKPRESARKLRAATVAQIIDSELAHLDKPSTLSVDVGINTLWAYRYVRSAHRYLWTASFATMGFAVPAAVDVAVRHPDEVSVAIVGDGGIGITLAELRNAADVRSPLVIVVFNNNALAAIKFESWIMGWPDRASGFHEIDFAGFARHCGVRATTVRSAKEFGNAFRTALAGNGPTLIDARIPAAEAPVLAGRAHIRQFAGLLTGWARDGKNARTGALSTLLAFGAEKAVRVARRADPRR